MSISRSSLGRGPAVVTFNSLTFFTANDLVLRHAPVWNPVTTSLHGQVDKFIRDRVYKIPLKLWGAWENLSTIFPSYAMNPTAGTSIFGTTDKTLAILARNGDKITYANAAITKVSNLYLGVDADLFSADVELTAILANSANPEDANAYYTLATGQAYSETTFAKTNFKKVRYTAAWGAITGFTAFAGQKGFSIGWDLDARPLTCDGLGTVDFTVGENTLQGSCKCIPIQPTLAQIEANSSAQGVQLGSLLSSAAADLVITGNGGSPVVTLKNAGMAEHGYVFGVEPLRVGEIGWNTTRGFSTGTAAAVGVVA
jgi:hypothetical protein